MSARGRTLFALTALSSLGACLEVPSGPEPECERTDDCGTGEVCETGTCWGNPPTGAFAYVLSPPAERPDLVTRELTNAQISGNGRISTIAFEQAVKFGGRVTATCTPPLMCDRAMLSANITITRQSAFPGGPGFKAVATTTTGATSTDGATFDVRLPPGTSDRKYTITVIPQPRGDAPATSPSLAEFVPPLRVNATIESAQNKSFTLGGLDLPTIEGTLLGATGAALSAYRVVALGRWEAGATPTEVSTIAYTGSDGAFRLVLAPYCGANMPADEPCLVGSVEIVAKPSDPTVVAPTLHLMQMSSIAAAQRTITQPPDLGTAITKVFTIKGKDGSGAIEPVSGARVRVSAQVGAIDAGFAVLTAEGSTDANGMVSLGLLDGASIRGLYSIEVVPPAGSIVGAIYHQAVVLTDGGELTLPNRVRLRGVVKDAHGEPVAGLAVTAQPALSFLWNLEDAPQAFLTSIPVSTASTNDAGEYVIWVDAGLADLPGIYDLSLDPARSTGFLERAPSWIQPGIEIPRDVSMSSVTVSDVWLPDAAFVHGQIADTSGGSVTNAELKIFRTSMDNQALCTSVANPPSPCPQAAQLLGRGAADASGIVALTLPR